jgi:phosphoribosyl 1,2-cyclic phosphodiesterase
MKLVFWGVRGSIPVPGALTKRYGGNSSCVQVSLNDDPTILIFDAGTGIRNLGKELGEINNHLDIHIFITHGHWDHIQGLPFFDPLFRKNRRITFYSVKRKDYPLKYVVQKVAENRYFPLSHHDWLADIRFVELEENEKFTINDKIHISTTKLNHPWIASAYRVDYDNKSIVYATDTAPFDHVVLGWEFISKAPDLNVPLSPEIKEELERMRKGLEMLCQDAKVVIYDTMFTNEQYNRNPHWGHSSPSHALEICKTSNVKNLVMFHHAPERSDEEMDKFLAETQIIADEMGISVTAAIEGNKMIITKNGVSDED